MQDSAESQIIYMMETIKTGREIGKGNAKKLRKIFETGSIEDITIAFSEIWERPSIPHNDRRVKWAKENAKHIIEVTDESEVGAAAMLEEEAEPIKEAEKAIYEPKGLAGAAAVSEVPELAKETKAGVDTVLLEEAAEPEALDDAEASEDATLAVAEESSEDLMDSLAEYLETSLHGETK